MKYGIFLVGNSKFREGIRVCESKKKKLFFSIDRAIKYAEKMAGERCLRGHISYMAIYNSNGIGDFEVWEVECPWWFDLIAMGLA